MGSLDGSRFDRLARSMASARSRRGLLGGLLGLGAGLAGLASGGAACPPGQVLGAGRRCLCRLTGRPPAGGVCPCPAGQCDFGAGCAPSACCADADCPPTQSCLAEGICGCAPNRVALSNGSCAYPCLDFQSPSPECAAACGGDGICFAALGDGPFCLRSFDLTGICTGGVPCPLGSACLGGIVSECFPLC
jgi:hypothetical protein